MSNLLQGGTGGFVLSAVSNFLSFVYGDSWVRLSKNSLQMEKEMMRMVQA